MRMNSVSDRKRLGAVLTAHAAPGSGRCMVIKGFQAEESRALVAACNGQTMQSAEHFEVLGLRLYLQVPAQGATHAGHTCQY